MMAMTTSSSMRVKPRRRERMGGLFRVEDTEAREPESCSRGRERQSRNDRPRRRGGRKVPIRRRVDSPCECSQYTRRQRKLRLRWWVSRREQSVLRENGRWAFDGESAVRRGAACGMGRARDRNDLRLVSRAVAINDDSRTFQHERRSAQRLLGQKLAGGAIRMLERIVGMRRVVCRTVF